MASLYICYLRDLDDCNINVSAGPISSQQVSCVVCSDGTFSDLNSSTQRCQNYTKCVNGTIVGKSGSKTTDVTCVPDPGMYSYTHMSTQSPGAENCFRNVFFNLKSYIAFIIAI